MNKKYFFGTLAFIVTSCLTLSSCYNNKSDITSIPPQVSFVNDVAPILTSGACGCHNGGTASAKQFSKPSVDSIYYSTIYGDKSVMVDWASGKTGHPGYGSIALTPGQDSIILAWGAENPPADYDVPSNNATTNVTYSGDIASIVSSTCGGGSCHGTNGGGAAGPALNYTTLTTTLNSTLEGYVNNNWSGHAGGVQAPSVTSTFQAWITAGMPQ